MNISTLNYLHGYLVENPIQTLIVRCHIVFLVRFTKRAWAACVDTDTKGTRKCPYYRGDLIKRALRYKVKDTRFIDEKTSADIVTATKCLNYTLA